VSEPAFTLGLEEEYLLVDRRTRDLARDPPADLVARCEAALAAQGQAGQVSPEFLRAQLEVQTGVCRTAGQLRAELVKLRRAVVSVASDAGLAPIAASTHPFAEWRGVEATDKDRYRALERDLQGVGRRLVICGLHVHVGIDDDELRVDLMNQIGYFLPHLLALSTSSPFWRGEDTGLASYRVAIFNELPRTGLPDHFESYGEYRRQLERLVAAGLVDDASKLWWDVRLSARFPTLEMRITDMCPYLDDAVAIASNARTSAGASIRTCWCARTAGAPSATVSTRASSISARTASSISRACSKRFSNSSPPTRQGSAARPKSRTRARSSRAEPRPTASARFTRAPWPTGPTGTKRSSPWWTVWSPRRRPVCRKDGAALYWNCKPPTPETRHGRRSRSPDPHRA
jgi:YbdK family carboxylate-amine ligase